MLGPTYEPISSTEASQKFLSSKPNSRDLITRIIFKSPTGWRFQIFFMQSEAKQWHVNPKFYPGIIPIDEYLLWY